MGEDLLARLQRRILSPLVTGALTSPVRRDLQRWVRETSRRVRGQAHEIRYFHQVDDPYSHLLAERLVALLEGYEIELVPRLVPPPSEAAAPDRERLVAYSRRDAAAIAPYYGLSFSDRGRQPSAELVTLAGRVLAGALDGERFAALAPRVGAALWEEDRAGLEAIARESPPVEETTLVQAMAAGESERDSLGHYLGAMLWYAGEWYWGIDRLHYLEERLARLGARRSRATGATRPRVTTSGAPAGTHDRPRLEFFLSLRSPYSYVSMPRVFGLAKKYPVDLVIRPVLPMVMRGLPVPTAKRLYIIVDTWREAQRAGVPFGPVADPIGRPIERGFSLFPWARAKGRGAEYLHSFARAAFADAIDTGSDAGLRKVVERIGLSWDEALGHLDGDDWREELEENRRAMFALGLWGVPSFHLVGPSAAPDFSTWGQDRIWLVEEEIRRRLVG